jgi:Holliday junction resolvase RusA-like endonuclease
MTLTIHVPGDPIAWARAGRRINLKNGTPITTTFTPTRVQQWEDHVAHFAQKAAAACGWTKPGSKIPLCVDVDFHFRRPSGYRKSEIWKWTKPDRDNLDKAILDALSWAGVIHDDAQVVDGRIRKLIDDEWQGAMITVTPTELVS